MDRGAWWATVHGIAESDMTKRAPAHTHTLRWKLHGLWALTRISSNQHLCLQPLLQMIQGGVCVVPGMEKWSNTSKSHSFLYVNQSSIKKF